MKKNDLEKNRRAIRNSTVDFLIFTKDASEDSIEVRVQDGEVWLTQDGIAQLFDVDRSVVTKHLKNICLLYTSPSPRDRTRSRMPSSA